MSENFARHSTTQTAAATRGTQQQVVTRVASCSASATPPISAMKVSSVTASDATRLSSPTRGPEPLADQVERRAAADGGDPAGHLGEHADADDADHHDPGQ